MSTLLAIAGSKVDPYTRYWPILIAKLYRSLPSCELFFSDQTKLKVCRTRKILKWIYWSKTLICVTQMNFDFSEAPNSNYFEIFFAFFYHAKCYWERCCNNLPMWGVIFWKMNQLQMNYSSISKTTFYRMWLFFKVSQHLSFTSICKISKYKRIGKKFHKNFSQLNISFMFIAQVQEREFLVSMYTIDYLD